MLLKQPILQREEKIKIVSPVENHIMNRIAPYKYRKLDDAVLITTDYGCFTILAPDEFMKLEVNNLTDELKQKLESCCIFVTKQNLNEIIRRYQIKYSSITRYPSLHIIELTNECDHNCIYCHAKSGKNEEIPKKMLSTQTANRILEHIFKTKRKKIAIELQGGEPTLNFSVVKHIIEKIKEQNIEVQTRIVSNLANTTNEQIDYLINNKCEICTSLDGPKIVHDANRMLSGNSSYERTIEKIRYIKETYNIQIGALTTITKNSLPYWKEIIDEFVALGIPIIHLRKVNSIGAATKNDANLTVEEYLDFWKKTHEYILELQKNGVNIQERYTEILKKKIRGEQIFYADLHSPCGMATGQIAYGADGKIYTCDLARGRELFMLGDVSEDIFEKQEIVTLIQNAINDLPACENCVFQPFCGICPVMMHEELGTIIGNPRGMEKCKINVQLLEKIFLD
jgi:His-Xaa-Ser system radical SAM maturase HxsB